MGKEILDKIVEYKHQILKLLVAAILIPLLTLGLERYVLGNDIPILVVMALSVGVTFLIISIYDLIVDQESEKARSQIARNTVNIMVIKEDVKALQEEIHKEDAKTIRERNWERALKRRGYKIPDE